MLTTFSKIFERIINISLKNYLDQCEILADALYRFRTGCCTDDAIKDFTDFVHKNLDEKSKPDTVSVPLLLSKLQKLGVRASLSLSYPATLLA